MAAYAEGAQAPVIAAKAAEDYQSITSERGMLQDAYKSADTSVDEAGKETKDMFKVNSLAAQMAASKGDTRLADKFSKAAQEQKTNEFSNQLNDLKVREGKLEMFERDLQTMNTAEDAKDMILKADMPMEQKMRELSNIEALKNNPAAFKQYKESWKNKAMTAYQRTQAEIQKVNAQIHQQTLAETKRHHLEMEKDAARRLDILEDKPDQTDRRDAYKEYQKDLRTINSDKYSKPEAIAAKKKEANERYQKRLDEIEGRHNKGGGKSSDKAEDQPDIPEDHINELLKNKDNPEAIASFNKRYGTKAMANPAESFIASRGGDSGSSSSPRSTASIKTDLTKAREERDAYKKEMGNPPGSAQLLKDPKAKQEWERKKKKLDELDAKVSSLKSAWIKSQQ